MASLLTKPAEASEGASVKQLRGLAAGLCVDAGILVEEGESAFWYYDHDRRAIVVPSRDIKTKGVHYCAGVLAHEVGHFYISRYHRFTQAFQFPSTKLLNHLLNCLEDPRVNRWIKARYPGARDWYRHLLADFESPDRVGVPEFLSFGIECHAEEMHGWQARPTGTLPPRIESALAATRLARQAATECLPSLVPDSVLLDDRLANFAAKTLTGRMEPVLPQGAGPMAARELDVLVHQARMLTLVRDGVCEEALKLLKTDCARLGWHLLKKDMQAELNTLARGGRIPNALKLKLTAEVIPAMQAVPQPPTTWEPSLAQSKALVKVMELFLEKAEQTGKVRVLGTSPHDRCGGRPGARSIGGSRGAGGKGIEERQQPLPVEEVSPSTRGVEQLARLVEDGLNPTRLRRHHGAFATGSKLSMREAMRLDAEPERYRKLWQRRIRPTRPDAAFGLLVDLSGSMRGEKIKAALAGTHLLAETLHRLEVPCLIHGFQDKLIPIAGWEDGYNEGVRNRIQGMGLEVSDSRPGGNNQMRFNDDGPCLEEFAALVGAHPARDRFVVVVSDGGPAGSRSTAEDLEKVIRTITRGNEVHLIGLGLGLGTDHVRRFYPRSIANVAEADFPSKIGGLILEACGVAGCGGFLAPEK